ncbi:uncharacterized protein LOC133926039 [Phragmites australis]|uniref:uncharacterized protein LOC133926039 n=1 Tax=Phragmites australis TaxID=29695 RepID=UPI002D78FE81|nr:uncharacterized protein LOC133926039 [Phragmites australis]
MAPMMTVPPIPGRPARSLAGHVRSASVPCHSHPLLMHVDDQLLALRSWTSNPGQNPLSLAHVRALLCVLDELLHLPLAQGALVRGAAACTDSLLDGFLVLADAFGSFLAALLALRQHASDLRAAVRRRDPEKLASAARAQRQVGKELEQLAAAVAREAARCARASLVSCSASAEPEIVSTVAEAINDTAVASASVFLEVCAVADAAAAVAASPSSSSKKQRLALVNASSRSKRLASEEQREAVALEKLQELELCIGELESESEKVFRSLVQTRVSLLNVHTPTF